MGVWQPRVAVGVSLVLTGFLIGLLAPAPSTVSAAWRPYQPLPPQRVLDTRQGLGAQGPVPAGSSITLDVTGVGGVPESAVAAVILNVTAAEVTSNTFLTVWPSGEPRPGTSNMNVQAGVDTASTVVAKVGPDGAISIANEFGTVQLIADVSGYFGADSDYLNLSPKRVLDTRSDFGAAGPVPPASTITIDIAGPLGVPRRLVSAAVLTITATQASASTFITGWATGMPKPPTSNLNVRPGIDTANAAIVPVAEDGTVTLANEYGDVHLIADITGYFVREANYNSLSTPLRLFDSRQAGSPLGPGTTVALDLNQIAPWAAGARGLVLNVTVVEATEPTHVTVWPGGASQPGTSSVNALPNIDTPNLVVASPGPDGTVSIANAHGSAHVIVDVFGSFFELFEASSRSPYWPYNYLYCQKFDGNLEVPSWSSHEIGEGNYGAGKWALSPDGDEFTYNALNAGNVEVIVREIHSGYLLANFPTIRNFSGEVDVSADGNLFAIAEDDLLTLYDRQGKVVREIPGIQDVAWARDDSLYFIGQLGSGHQVFGAYRDIRTDEAPEIIADRGVVLEDERPTSLAVSRDGSKISYTQGGDIWIQPADHSDARLVAYTGSGSLLHSAFSPDGTLIAVVMNDLSRFTYAVPSDGPPVNVVLGFEHQVPAYRHWPYQCGGRPFWGN